MKKIVFRADGNSETGLGHLYRIFALIEIYKPYYDCVLVTKENSELSAIPKKYQTKLISTNIALHDEPAYMNTAYPADTWIIMADGYQFDAIYQKALKDYHYKLIYVDDQVKEKMYADIVINHALSISQTDYTAEPYTRFALGTSYAILRPLFLEAAKQAREIKQISTAFVCFGGADPSDLTLKATQALINNSAIKKINVVIGAAYKHQHIKELTNRHSHLKVFQNVSESDLIQLMGQSDFAIAPASTILYELCCVKMPILSGYYVENQKNIYKGCLENTCIIEGGDFEKYDVVDFEEKINNILLQKDYQKYILSQSKLFDAQIRNRFLNLICPINYRKANESDMMLLYDWSNEATTRANSYHTEPIALDVHRKWFEKKLTDANTVIYVAEVEDQPAGIIRYEIGDKSTVVGIIVSKEFRGRGLAAIFLSQSAELYFKEHLLPINAYIKTENISSKRSFEKAKYKFVKEELIHNAMSYVYKLEKNDIFQ